MLTRLQVSGFKNLVDVDVRFGPFTCVAGLNGSGKSNLFDAIHFLSALSDHPLMDAAMMVRDERRRSSDIRSLFHHVGDSYDQKISLVAEMIVPKEGVDDLGQKVLASVTFLRYTLVLGYRGSNRLGTQGNLEVLEEELLPISQRDSQKNLGFPHSVEWSKSIIKGRRSSKSPLISTVKESANILVKLHQDRTKGKPFSRLASDLPRTVLSVANAAESPTVLLARREMQSWRLLHLEPSALRSPDSFTASVELGEDGSYLAATLYRLAHSKEGGDPSFVYGQVANRLANLIQEIQEIWVDRDDQRELLTVQAKNFDGTVHPARSLSDGSLRFLALAVMELDPHLQGILCLEEPENGIHPERIPAMLQLLQDICTDTNLPVGVDNPLRQVIINTHSPSVVAQVPEQSLLVAGIKEIIKNEKRFHGAFFGCLSVTWRAEGKGSDLVSKGELLAYLNPILSETREEGLSKRVIDRKDMQNLLQGPLDF